MNILTVTSRWAWVFFMLGSLLTFSACNDDDEAGPTLNGNNTVYTLAESGDSGISGTVTFAELSNGNTTIVIDLEETTSGMMLPAHIHFNTAAESGGIAVSLEPVDGSTGSSTTVVSSQDDGTSVTYTDLSTFDGYINIHESADNLANILAQADIGQNALTGDEISYTLDERSMSGVSGTATFYERINNETLVVLDLEGTPAEGVHPAHIHVNTAAEGGGIAVSLNEVDGASGLSKTNVTRLDESAGGGILTYENLIGFDGYINVHLSADELATVVAQGDIGQNALTGNSVSYELGERGNSGVAGTATFYERLNEETLVEISLTGTPADGNHPAHIHFNSFAEGGNIAVSLTNVDGATGMSRTNVTMQDGGEGLTYSELIAFDGYINVHLSASELGIVVAQGDIGQNALTGESVSYTMSGDATGTATFYERNSGETLVILELTGYAFSGDHPSHIHSGSVASPGGIAISLSKVDADGYSQTHIASFDQGAGGEPVTYNDLITFDGYINVHLSDADLGTLISQGDIGSNG